MYKCENCRHVTYAPMIANFEDGAALACPHCGDTDLTPGDRCQECGQFYEAEDLFGGWCLDCLREQIDYPTGLSYLLDWEYLRTFLETVDGDYARTADQHALLMAFLIHETEDRNYGRETFLEALRDYIMDDPVSVRDFADWLEEENA